MSKPKRVNLCQAVRELLGKHNISVYRVVQSIVADQQKLELAKLAEPKTGGGKLTSKNTQYSVGVNLGSETYKGGVTLPLAFDAWNTAFEKLMSIASFNTDTLELPEMFRDWLKKYEKKAGEKPEENDVEIVIK
jgi:hypothetical protein